MGSEAHLSSLLLSRPGRPTRPAHRLLLACRRVVNLLPQKLYRRGTQIAIDCCMASCAVLLAYQFRFDFSVPVSYAPGMWLWILIMGIIRPAALIAGGTCKVPWRCVDLRDMTSLMLASLPPTFVLLALRFAIGTGSWAADVPLGVIVIELALFVGMASGVRGIRRLVYEDGKHFPSRRKRALMLGTEEMLPAAVAQMRTLPEVELAGLVTPGGHMRGFRIRRVPVVGEPSDLATLLANSGIDTVIIADASADWISAARATATAFGADVYVLPSAANVMHGQVRVTTPVDPGRILAETRTDNLQDQRVIDAYRDRVVLVTGAGGSIGLELSRQVLRLGISRLVLLDRDESAVFEADRALKSADVEVVPLVGDIRDQHLLNQVFAQHKPEIVLHSAAFKHVPVMESNASEAVLNNVQGTRLLADAANRFHCERFVMISSDKAVKPASVMGATKRIAEMLIQSRALSSQTKFACVRFGNVVGSRGSVVPIFLKQIANGDPITITDERMRRYFMTVHEAVRLVLQASSLASAGEVYTLDMGEPMRITDLARRITEMSGLDPHKDIQLETIGIRPGEKLHEQLWHEDMRISGTEFPGVYVLDPEGIPANFEESARELEEISIQHWDNEVIEKLEAMPIDYKPRVQATR